MVVVLLTSRQWVASRTSTVSWIPISESLGELGWDLDHVGFSAVGRHKGIQSLSLAMARISAGNPHYDALSGDNVGL